jgi:hypothetical protein
MSTDQPVSGPWTIDEIKLHLRRSIIPLRMAVLDRHCFPIMVSLWFLFDKGAIWCATPEQSHVVRYLTQKPRCGFEVSSDQPPYRGVRGRASVTLDKDLGPAVLERLLARYGVAPGSTLAKTLTARSSHEMAIRVEPIQYSSWDFSMRMADALQPRPIA